MIDDFDACRKEEPEDGEGKTNGSSETVNNYLVGSAGVTGVAALTMFLANFYEGFMLLT